MNEIKETKQGWECGKDNAGDVIATLSGTTLTISGKKEMKDYTSKIPAPWHGESITDVIIQEGITNIGGYAFLDCFGLTSITIPSSITTISYCAFYDCTVLKFVTIPSSVTVIGDYAFWNCSSLASVVIPEKVTWIGRHAFKSITNSITNLNPAPQIINEETFSNNFRDNVTLYVPAALVNTYKIAPVWNTFRNITPKIEEKQPDAEFTSEQLEEEILRISKEISELTVQRENLRFKILCMRGLEGSPKDVATFMSLFNQRDGLKYLTHDFDETGNFDADTFLAQTRKVFGEHLEQLHIPSTLSSLLNQFAFENNPEWTAFDKEYNLKKITSGWSAPDWQEGKASGLHPIKQPQFAEVIKDFKRLTRIESPNLETLIDKIFDDETFEIEKRDLSKADFYTHVEQFSSALQTIFEEIQQRGDTDEKKKILVEYKRAGSCDDFFIRNVVITHPHSYPTRDDEDLIKEWLGLEKGNMGKIAKLLKGYCHWSVITKIGENPVKVNILREKGILEREEIDAAEVKGFTHILTFYYQ